MIKRMYEKKKKYTFDYYNSTNSSNYYISRQIEQLFIKLLILYS